jgi:hypothetical protein
MNLANPSSCNIHIARMFPFPWANELLEIIQVGQPFTLCVGLCYPELVPFSEAASCNILYNPFKVQWALYVPPGLTFRNSTFCPHCVCMCYAWITVQTAIIFLYSINWLVFITVTESVYCAVRIESLNTTVARVRFQVNSCEICGWQRYTGTGFSPSTSVSPVSIIPPMLHTHSFIHLPPTLYNVFLPALQFPLSVSFHQCSILTPICFTRWTYGRRLEIFQKIYIWKSCNIWYRSNFTYTLNISIHFSLVWTAKHHFIWAVPL